MSKIATISFSVDVPKFREELNNKDNTILGKIYDHCKGGCKKVYLQRKIARNYDFYDIYHDAILRLTRGVISHKITELTNTCGFLHATFNNISMEKIREQKRVDSINALLLQHNYIGIIEKDEENLIKIEKCIDTLRDKCQKIINMSYYLNLSAKQIAEKLEMANPNVVRVTRCNCLKQLIDCCHSK